MKFCASTFNFPLRFNNFARTCSKLWAMLAKKSFDLWKPKNQIAIVWIFYALLNFSSLEISSNSNSTSQAEHMKCVVCYPFIPNEKQKKVWSTIDLQMGF
jgi:hypothetical protein